MPGELERGREVRLRGSARQPEEASPQLPALRPRRGPDSHPPQPPPRGWSRAPAPAVPPGGTADGLRRQTDGQTLGANGVVSQRLRFECFKRTQCLKFASLMLAPVLITVYRLGGGHVFCFEQDRQEAAVCAETLGFRIRKRKG